MAWRTEFGPDWDVPALIDTDPHLVDTSWHNDECPSFVLAGDADGDCDIRLWIDHPDPNERDDAPRYHVSNLDGYIIETDDPAEALAALKERAMTAASGW